MCQFDFLNNSIQRCAVCQNTEKEFGFQTFFITHIKGARRYFAAGGVFDGSAEDQGEWFNVWSSSRNSNSNNAWNLNGNSDNMNMNNNNRYNGLSVRGVLGALNVYFLSCTFQKNNFYLTYMLHFTTQGKRKVEKNM